MGLDRDTMRHFHEMLRPLRNRIANSLVRAAVKLVSDGKKLQRLQVDGFEGGPVDDAEHFQPYGFSSVPMEGAEAIVFFPNGDRERPLVLAAADRRYRPTGGDPGEVGLYDKNGRRVYLKSNGQIWIYGGGLVESTIKADTYRTAEDTMLIAIAAALTAAATGFTNLGQAAAATACTTAATAITTFRTAAATYKTTVAKVE